MNYFRITKLLYDCMHELSGHIMAWRLLRGSGFETCTPSVLFLMRRIFFHRHARLDCLVWCVHAGTYALLLFVLGEWPDVLMINRS